MTNIYEIISALIGFTMLLLFIKLFGIELKKERDFYLSDRGYKIFLEREKTKRLYIEKRGKRP